MVSGQSWLGTNMHLDYILTAIRMGTGFEAQGGSEIHIYAIHSDIASLFMSCLLMWPFTAHLC